jgi:hypothetical protein
MLRAENDKIVTVIYSSNYGQDWPWRPGGDGIRPGWTSKNGRPDDFRARNSGSANPPALPAYFCETSAKSQKKGASAPFRGPEID